jgi:hypothetical protein
MVPSRIPYLLGFISTDLRVAQAQWTYPSCNTKMLCRLTCRIHRTGSTIRCGTAQTEWLRKNEGNWSVQYWKLHGATYDGTQLLRPIHEHLHRDSSSKDKSDNDPRMNKQAKEC